MERVKRRVESLLKSNITYVILGVILGIYLALCFGMEKKKIYEESDTEFGGVVTKKVVSSNKVSFHISNSENLICNYYSDDEEEKEGLWNGIKLGSEVSIRGTLKRPLNNTIPNTFNYKKYLYNQGMFYTCSVDEIEEVKRSINPLYGVKNFVIERIRSYDTKDYLMTMITGDKSLLDEDTLDKYRNNGVTHLFAISGMHVGLFALILTRLLKKFKLSEKKASIVVTIFIWFYAFLAGFGASVVRSAVFFTFLTIDKLFEFKLSKIKLILLAGATLIFANHNIVTDIGFVYSFITTFGLIWSSKIIEKHKVVGTSLVANLWSLPITIQNFYKFNMASIAFNIVFVPLVSVVVYPLCLATFFLRFLEPVLKVSIWFLEIINDICSKIDILIFVVPKMNIIAVVIYYGILFLFIRKSLYKVGTILFVIVLLNKLKPILDSHDYVEFLDVGQGDSTIIRSAHGREVIMVDTGGIVGESSSNYNVSDNTITYLNSLGIDTIDYLILTHGDADHLGDAMHIIENMKVKNVILNKGKINPKEKEIIASKVHVSESYNGNLRIRSLNDKIWDDENSNSIILQLNFKGIDFMLMGDASKEVEKYILGENKIRADVVKLGHHGSKTSSDYEFLKRIGAKMGIISAGRNNRYRHPNKETLDTLNDLGIEKYNTQVDGSIIFKLKGRETDIYTCPP